ncbi:unnamed protein product, partial [Didymodactylos carnosus]
STIDRKITSVTFSSWCESRKTAFHPLPNNKPEDIPSVYIIPTLLKNSPSWTFRRFLLTGEQNLSIWSNKYYKNALISYINNIYQRMYSYESLEKIVNKYNNPLFHDELDVLNMLLTEMKQTFSASSSTIKKREQYRAIKRLEEFQCIYETKHKTKFTFDPPSNDQINFNINSYFDLGCGDAQITVLIGEYLKLSKENIYGGDIYNMTNNEITYVQLLKDRSLLRFFSIILELIVADDQVNLITCLVTLHHVESIDCTLNEIKRILRHDGYLIIREHDCKTERSLDAKYLNFIHAIMMIENIGEFKYENPCDDNDWPRKKQRIIDYVKTIKYHTRQEWDKKIEALGFKKLKTAKYPNSNPQKLFYAIYKLQKNR